MSFKRSIFNVVLCYKHYQSNPGISHIGLGVTAMNCAKYLSSRGIRCSVFPAAKEKDIEDYLNDNPDVTHFNVSALWVKTATLAKWAAMFPKVQFSITCHSNAAFLQHEPEAITLIREGTNLEELSLNFHVCGNNERFCQFIEQSYGGVCSHLPNLYWVNTVHNDRHHTQWAGGILRIGIFGAMRSLKNFNTAAAAAAQIARMLRVNTEVWVNVARRDSSDADVVLRAVRNTLKNLPRVELVEMPWAPWPEFRKNVGSMNLLLQPSHSETFNNVTADGIAEGVPSVVSDTIEWAPDRWKANVDDVNDIATTGVALLMDPNAARVGLQALQRRNQYGFGLWLAYLKDSYNNQISQSY